MSKEKISPENDAYLAKEHGKTILAVARERGYNQRSIGTLLGITSQSEVSRKLNGHTRITTSALRKLYEALGQDKRLYFLPQYISGVIRPSNQTPISIDAGYISLLDIYFLQIRDVVLASPVETRLAVVADLDQLVKKYSSSNFPK